MLLSRGPSAESLAPALERETPSGALCGGGFIPCEHLDLCARTRWAALASQAAAAAPFQQPEFVLSAAGLESTAAPWLWLGSNAESLAAGGVFESVAPSPRHPYRLLRTWQTPYTFRDDLVLSGRPMTTVWGELWDEVRTGGWHAVEFPQLPADSLTVRQLLTASSESALVSLGTPWTRPVLRRDRSGPAALRAVLSPQRRKSLHRGWRWLERAGAVDIAVLRSREAVERAAQTLLRLEALGWKGEQGTALASRAEHRRFFLNFVQQLAARGGIAFVELRVANEPIASLAVLLHAAEGFAFKIGWDPQWERGCPGFQLMSQLVSLMPSEFPDLERIDSCASPDSFIGRVWPDRAEFAACLVSLTRRAQLCTTVREGIRSVRSLA